MIAKCAARGLALSALLLAGPSLAFAQAHDMAGMPGMGGPSKIDIPPGAGITVADVQFMQGISPTTRRPSTCRGWPPDTVPIPRCSRLPR